jgi:UDP-sugar transporter A1/2/3
VSLVLKYADSILKSFATSLAILLSCLLSWIWFDFVPTVYFGIGAFLVMISVFLYNRKSVGSGETASGQKLPYVQVKK